MLGEINSLMVIPISFARSIRIDLAQNFMSNERIHTKNKRVKRVKKTWLICVGKIREERLRIFCGLGNHESVTIIKVAMERRERRVPIPTTPIKSLSKCFFDYILFGEFPVEFLSFIFDKLKKGRGWIIGYFKNYTGG